MANTIIDINWFMRCLNESMYVRYKEPAPLVKNYRLSRCLLLNQVHDTHQKQTDLLLLGVTTIIQAHRQPACTKSQQIVFSAICGYQLKVVHKVVNLWFYAQFQTQ